MVCGSLARTLIFGRKKLHQHVYRAITATLSSLVDLVGSIYKQLQVMAKVLITVVVQLECTIRHRMTVCGAPPRSIRGFSA